MRSFKLFWNIHKWTGIVLASVLTVTAVTGFMLLLKKRVSWLQPPTHEGAAGSADEFISTQQLFDVVFSQGHPDFREVADIDRVDLRPQQRVFKVRSVLNYSEI